MVPPGSITDPSFLLLLRFQESRAKLPGFNTRSVVDLAMHAFARLNKGPHFPYAELGLARYKTRTLIVETN